MLARKRVAELMDDPALDADLHQEALRGLEKLNVVSSSVDLLWSQLRTIKTSSGNVLRILDLASGAGDIPIGICKRAKQENVPIEIVASDISPTAIEYAARKAASQDLSISFIQMDVLNDPVPSGFDATICSLFTHHLDPPDVVNLMRKMHSSSRRMLIVNDLVRSEISLALVWLGTRLFSRSKIVQYDGPVSVCASYTRAEMLAMAREAGLNNCVSIFHPPCRQLLVWEGSK